jgi:hypothetical protein
VAQGHIKLKINSGREEKSSQPPFFNQNIIKVADFALMPKRSLAKKQRKRNKAFLNKNNIKHLYIQLLYE